jgi:hypothetical protein
VGRVWNNDRIERYKKGVKRMTREEASFYLANMDRKYMEEGMSEALDMAIRSLEAWKDVQKEIYRQIDYLDEIHEFRDKKAYFKALDIVNKYLKEVQG